ncbi:MAG: chitobiase/beta-hexosaminidase C-terminal domain-containing protein, partial [Muribaculaceae bacterium]|nr:chitobiase/beta-hexosaminidase C-terminal domain-containing protein [Muribaculaceae bacterium]
MRLLKLLLPLMVFLHWSTAAKAQYNPADPPEPGVNFTLTTRCEPAEAGYYIYGGGTHAFGSEVFMQVSSTQGYRFVCWENEDGTIVSTTENFTYVMPAKNVVLTARFVYDPSSPAEPSTPEFKDISHISFKMNPSDAGYVYYGYEGDYEVGTTLSITVNTNENYRFVSWTCEGIELGTSSTLEYTVPKGDRVLEANFEYDPTSPAEPGGQRPLRMLKVQSNPKNAASVRFLTDSYHDESLVEEGVSVPVAASENEYYSLVNWTDDEGNVVSVESSFFYVMPDRKVTLTANFSHNYDPTSPGEPGIPNPDGSIAENMVMWPRMGMYDDTHVQILCETPGATIHYTLDGSTPNADSHVYTEPVFVPSNLLVKAIAYKEGMEDSPVVSYQVTAYKAGTPVFTFENLKLKITSSTEGATIRFTTDFTDPTEESEIYTQPFEPEDNCRIKAYASKEGLADSQINVFVFRRADYTIPAPTLEINEEGLLEIIPSVSGGNTYYSLDGTDPTTESSLYTEPLALDGNFVVRAYTVHSGFYDSPIGEYVIDGYQVATPTCEYKDLALTLATTTSGATVRYTTDGSVPTEESAAYSAPLRLTEDCKVVARGFKANYEPSDTISYTFIYADHVVATPVLTYDPEALTITMACDTINAEIRYTIDGEAPTAETGIKYEGPVAVVGNHTYTAKAFRSDLFDSESASVTVDDQKVPTPTASFANKVLTLSCSDAEAAIRYTIDGTEPTAESALYEAPVALTEDCTVKFIAMRQYFLDSETGTYEFQIADHQVATPELTYDPEALTITIACDTDGAEIRYTIDGEAPTAETGIKYEGPISVVGNHTYTAKAFRSDLFDSEEASVTVDDRKVTAPVVTHSLETMKVTMTCATVGAQIRYTTDGTVPTPTTGTVYTEPIDITGNMTFTVRAFLADFIESDVTVYEVPNMKLPAPTASYGKHYLTLASEEDSAQIRYTVNGDQPTSSSTLYSEPIPMTEDCTVRFIATKAGYNDSDEATYNFVLSQWKETIPTIGKDFEGRRVFVENADGAAIRVIIDGEERICNSLESIDVVPEMRLLQVSAIATDEDRYDSETISEELVFHLPPKVDYDGHAVHYGPAEGDPASASANVSIFMDDVYRHGGVGERTMEVSYMARLTAVATSDNAFRSDTVAKEIDYFNTGRVAAARNGHRISEGFGTWGDNPDEYTYLYINGGEIEKEDLEFLGSLPNLTALHLAPNHTTTEPCDGVFANSALETIFAYSIPQGMLKGMKKLTTVMWGITNERMPEGRLAEADNPNILLWVFDEDKAPSDAINVVTYPYISGDAPTDPDGAGVTGTAKKVALMPGYPFGVHMPIDVEHIELTKEFTMPTVIGECAGWETITLPFDAASIIHEQAGEIVPFSLWKGPEDSFKPFWLYNAAEEGWVAASAIQARTPYIISMPNNEDYVYGYNLPGKVTFAAEGVTLIPDSVIPKADKWLDGTEFVGTFMPVEETGIRSINVNMLAGRDWLGSAFVTEDKTLPFGAYLRGEGMPKQIPVFGDWSGVLTPVAEASGSGIMVETPAAGTIRVSSSRECNIAVTTATGVVARTLHLKAGETVVIEGLTRDIYI